MRGPAVTNSTRNRRRCRRTAWRTTAVFAAFIAALAAAAPAAVAAPPGPSTGMSPRAVHPNADKYPWASDARLFQMSTAALSTKNAWTVGYAYAASGNSITLSRHWNGKKWTRVPTPNSTDGVNSELTSVAAVSADDIWAVGDSTDADGVTMTTLVEHWDGTSWSIVSGASLPDSAGLSGVSAVASDDVWAVGVTIDSDGVYHTLSEHWDGSAWSVVDAPDPEGSLTADASSIVAISTDDVWLAGFYFDSSGEVLTYAEHWDGTQWTVTSTPNGDGAANVITGMAATSSNDVWAVGYTNGDVDQTTLIEHWDGTSWSIVATPFPSGWVNAPVYSVSATSASDAWVVGELTVSNGDGTNDVVALTEHWDGSSWTAVDAPSDPSRFETALSGVSAVSPHKVIATGYVGRYIIGSYEPFDLKWNGSAWTSMD